MGITCPVTETLEDSKATIYDLCHQFKGKIPGVSFDELISEANFCWLKAYQSYDSDLGDFNTWIYEKIFRGLQELQRQKFKEYERRKKIIWEKQPERKQEYTLEKVFRDVGEDAQAMIKDLLEAPKDLQRAVTEIGGYKKLSRHFGWTLSKVRETVAEIYEALL